MAVTQGFCHIHLFVRDIERAVRIYQQGLGMREAFRDGSKFIPFAAVYDPDGYAIELYTPDRDS